MSLINCWECGKQISAQAKNCPHCGAPKQNEMTESFTKNGVDFKNNQKSSPLEPNKNKYIPNLTNTKKPNIGRNFLIIFGVLLLVYFLSKIPISQNGTDQTGTDNSIENYEHTIKKMLIAGEWDAVIKILKSVPNTGKYYNYTQQKLKRLTKGYNLFRNARGRWKCETDGEVLNDCLDLSGNTIVYSSKFSGNTWFVNYNNGKGWEIDKRFIDYLDNGHLLVAGFIDGKVEDKLFEIWQ